MVPHARVTPGSPSTALHSRLGEVMHLDRTVQQGMKGPDHGGSQDHIPMLENRITRTRVVDSIWCASDTAGR